MYIKTVMSNMKVNNYLSDGTGRDTYVGNYNGGIWKTNQIQPIRPESGTFPRNRSYASPAPRIDSKVNRYKNDGTGRDGYISYDDGGFTISLGASRNFISTLRNYNTKSRCQTRESSPMLYTASRARSITNRLHYAKQSEDPYKSIRKLSSLYYKK